MKTKSAKHDFHLLIKPVLPNKLRAMIGVQARPTLNCCQQLPHRQAIHFSSKR